MAIYEFAGTVVELRNHYPFLEKQCRGFLSSGEPSITIEVTQEEIRQELDKVGKKFSPGYAESICAYRKLCLQIPKLGGLFLHASVIRVGDRGIAFLAPSGTGKTTHTGLWQDLLGDKLTVINGDKPIVRMTPDGPVAYGTPWAGKEGLYEKDSVTLTDLCFLERSKENSCTPLPPEQALTRIVHQVILPGQAQTALQTLDLLDRLLRSCRLWLLRCNIHPDAAKCAYSKIFNE